jgi:hypothetical protein
MIGMLVTNLPFVSTTFTVPVAGVAEFTFAENERDVPTAVLIEELTRVNVLGDAPPPPPAPPLLPAPQPKRRHSKQAMPIVVTRRFVLRPDQGKSRMAASTRIASHTHKCGGPNRLTDTPSMGITSPVELEDGGKVLIVAITGADAAFVSDMGDGGLKEQLAPATLVVSQESVTELAALLSGEMVRPTAPLPPAVIVTAGVADDTVKSGTVTGMVRLDPAS